MLENSNRLYGIVPILTTDLRTDFVVRACASRFLEDPNSRNIEVTYTSDGQNIYQNFQEIGSFWNKQTSPSGTNNHVMMQVTDVFHSDGWCEH